MFFVAYFSPITSAVPWAVLLRKIAAVSGDIHTITFYKKIGCEHRRIPFDVSCGRGVAMAKECVLATKDDRQNTVRIGKNDKINRWVHYFKSMRYG